MWYLKNISEQKLVDPETGKEVAAGEVKSFSNEFAFLRFCAVNNGSVKIVTEKEYNQYLGTFGKLSQQKSNEKDVNNEAVGDSTNTSATKEKSKKQK